jgi:hypothetical protein
MKCFALAIDLALDLETILWVDFICSDMDLVRFSFAFSSYSNGTRSLKTFSLEEIFTREPQPLSYSDFL